MRKTCSTVSERFLLAFCVFIASFLVVMFLIIGKKASIPLSLHSRAPSDTTPANANTFTPDIYVQIAQLRSELFPLLFENQDNLPL